MIKLGAVAIAITALTTTTSAFGQAPPAGAAPAPAAPAQAVPAQPAPPPGYGYPPPAYGYPPPAYGYPPPPPYGYPPPGHGYPQPGYPTQRVVAPQQPGYHTHDGLYVRSQMGLAYTSMSTSEGGFETKLSGAGASIGVAVGMAVMENVILYGTGLLAGNSEPTVTAGGITQDNANVSADFYGVGGGLAYYLVPANVYLAGSLLASWVSLSDTRDNNEIGRTKAGLSVEGLVGKEWWVSTNWGLGLALQLFYGRMSDSTITAAKTPWTAAGGALLFSATFN